MFKSGRCHLNEVFPVLTENDVPWRRGVAVSGVRRVNEVNARRAR